MTGESKIASMTTKMPWDEEGDPDEDDDEDPFNTDRWLNLKRNNWLPKPAGLDGDYNEFARTPADKKWDLGDRLAFWIHGNFRKIAGAAGATEKPYADAYKAQEELKFTVKPPELRICDDCDHGESIYDPEDRTIHVQQKTVEFIFSWKEMMALRSDTTHTGIDGNIARYIHHHKCPEAYKPQDKNSIEYRDRKTLQGCIARLSEFVVNAPLHGDEIKKTFSHEYTAMRKYKRLFKKKPEIFEKASTEQLEFLHSGWGKILANELYRFTFRADVVLNSWEDGSYWSILREIVKAPNLEGAAEMLLQHAEGNLKRPYDNGEKGIARLRDFYTACAYKFLALNNSLRGQGKELPVKG